MITTHVLFRWPVGLASRWAATSNVEVDQTTYPINRGRVWREGRERSEGQSHLKRRGEEWNGMGEWPRNP